MSATLLALLESTLPQQADSDDVCPAKAQVISHLAPVGLSAPKAQMQAREMPSGTNLGGGKDFAALLADLVGVAAELARMDEMLAQAEASAPASAEARKWHEVSVQALVWSREALAERQNNLLVQMKVLSQVGCADKAVAVSSESIVAQTYSPTQPEAALSLEAVESETAVVGSLRADLERLRGYSKEQCLLVRKIKRLGLESPQKLRTHFERYGAVSEVLVAHSFEKPSAKRRNGRMRPAAIGFIVMAADAAATAILATGESHMIQDGTNVCEVSVQPYNPQAAAGDLELEV